MGDLAGSDPTLSISNKSDHGPTDALNQAF